MWKPVLVLLAMCALLHAEEFKLRSDCGEPLYLGDEKCENNETSSIRWHMDEATLTCLAFKYTGCGGNTNNFDTKDHCQRHCLPMDFQTCPANTEPVRREDNSTHCQLNVPVPLECPTGSVCKMGFAVGLCCDAKLSEQVSANYKPDCGPTKKFYKSEQFGFQLIHLGKSCSHNFCPANASCHEGAFFAYCCV